MTQTSILKSVIENVFDCVSEKQQKREKLNENVTIQVDDENKQTVCLI